MRFRLKAVIYAPDYVAVQQDTIAVSKKEAIGVFMNLVNLINDTIGNFDVVLSEVSELLI